jgi:regulator of replication initiation timing
MATKQEIEQQLADAIAVAQRLNEEMKTLKSENNQLKSENISLRNDFNSAVERVRILDNQIRMLQLERHAKAKYSDNDRNY